MMNCPSCDRDNPEGSAFCNECGSPLTDEARMKAEKEKAAPKGEKFSGCSVLLLLLLVAGFVGEYLFNFLPERNARPATASTDDVEKKSELDIFVEKHLGEDGPGMVESVSWEFAGRKLEECGEIPLAEEAYRRALALEPENPSLLTALAVLQIDNDPDLASEMLEKALAVDNSSVDAHWEFAKLACSKGDADKAAPSLEAVMNNGIGKRRYEAALLLAEIAFDRGDFSAAADFMKRAEPGGVLNAEQYARYAEAMEKTGEKTRAASYYEKALQAGSQDKSLAARLAKIYCALGMFDKARPHLDTAIIGFPEDAELVLCDARALENSGDLDAAFVRYEDYVRQKPGDWLARFELAGLCNRMGDTSSAARYLEAALSLKPGHPEMLCELGVIYLHNPEKYGRGIELLEDACRQRPDLARAQYHLGAAYYSLRSYEKAEKALLAAESAAGEYPRLYFLLGKALWKNGKKDEAAEYFKKSLALKPDDVEAWYALALLEDERDDVDAALEATERVVGLNESHFGALILKADLLIKKKDFKGATAVYRTILGIDKVRAKALQRKIKSAFPDRFGD